MSTLITTNHNRDIVGLKYVYPVLSRRAGGLSIGINFNTNNACNWRCIYCQVPDLIIGAAPEIDFHLLEDELRFFLNDVLHGDFYRRFQVSEHNKSLKILPFPAMANRPASKTFAEAEFIGDIATEFGVFPSSHFVLITNGSLIHQPKVQEGLKALKAYGGEVWFKFDSATKEGRALINNTRQSCQKHLKNIACRQFCATKLQTCLLDYAGQGLSETEKQAYLDVLKTHQSNER